MALRVGVVRSSGTFASLIETKLNSVDPQSYFADVLGRLVHPGVLMIHSTPTEGRCGRSAYAASSSVVAVALHSGRSGRKSTVRNPSPAIAAPTAKAPASTAR